MSPAEVVWLSGLALGLLGGLPIGMVLAFVLPQTVRLLTSRTEHDRRP